MSEQRVQLVIAVADEDGVTYTAVVAAVRDAGLDVTGEQPALGTIAGTAAADCVETIAAVPGVRAVERSRTLRAI